MHHIPENLKFLRKKHKWTQDDFAHQLGVKRSMIGAYEEGRADPRISFLQLVAQKFKLSLDQLISANLESKANIVPDIKGHSLRVLPITIEKDTHSEMATMVPIKAAAGYLNGFGDVEFIENLPSFSLPFPELPRGKTYRLFQIEGDSMLTIESGSYIITTFLQDWNNVKNDLCYVFVTKSDGIVFKRALNNLKYGNFSLKSDNKSFDTFDINVSEILEIWQAEGVARIGFPQEPTPEFSESMGALSQVHERLDRIEKKLDQNQ